MALPVIALPESDGELDESYMDRFMIAEIVPSPSAPCNEKIRLVALLRTNRINLAKTLENRHTTRIACPFRMRALQRCPINMF